MEKDYSVDELTGRRLLLVDDDPVIVRIMSKMLNNLGFDKVTATQDGVEAVDFMQRSETDLLLTDIQMPGINGLELIRRLRGGLTASPRETPAVIFSAISSDEHLSTALSLDVNGFLPKPVKPLSLAHTLLSAFSEQFDGYRPAADYLDIITDLDAIAPISADPGSGEFESGDGKGERRVKIFALEPDMVLSREVRHTNGSLLMSPGFVLKQHTINRLLEIRENIAGHEFFIEPGRSGSAA